MQQKLPKVLMALANQCHWDSFEVVHPPTLINHFRDLYSGISDYVDEPKPTRDNHRARRINLAPKVIKALNQLLTGPYSDKELAAMWNRAQAGYSIPPKGIRHFFTEMRETFETLLEEDRRAEWPWWSIGR